MERPPRELLHRARGEFLEMPGLSLTLEQAQRLWGIGRDDCVRLLGALVAGGFLARRADGTYVRRGAGPGPRPTGGHGSMEAAHATRHPV